MKTDLPQGETAADTDDDLKHWMHVVSGVLIAPAADDEDETVENRSATGRDRRRHRRQKETLR